MMTAADPDLDPSAPDPIGRPAAGTGADQLDGLPPRWCALGLSVPSIASGGAQGANGGSLGTLGDDLCFPCRDTSGCIDSWDACPVLGTGEVRVSTKTARQRFADILPNWASKPKSMTPSGKMATKSPRCRIASRSKPQGESVPKFQ